jgi:hypothetical protein
MDVNGKKVMVLGGYGEVGLAICRKILGEMPKNLIVTSLKEEEALHTVKELKTEAPDQCMLSPVHGNLFVRWSLKDMSRDELLSNPDYQKMLAEDVLEEFNEDILTSSTLFRVISEYGPDIIVDCINTATALAYQDVYQSYKEISAAIKANQTNQELTRGIYRFLSTLYIPPLVRYAQILCETMKRMNTRLYLKIGTTGTGGMGLNIPFTHGEARPSRLLLSKTAVAGAQTLLLYLASITPGGPIVKELKPAAMIGWKKIERGPIRVKGGKAIPLYDCSLGESYNLADGETFCYRHSDGGFRIEGKDMTGVYVDTGENGVFSLDEFKLCSTLNLMEYITPEEIARSALCEIKGITSAKDVLGAIAGTVMGPTYRAGFLRDRAIRQMEALSQEGVAYGLLGPRTVKLIIEAHLIKSCYETAYKVVDVSPQDMSQALEATIKANQELRSASISLGVPILFSDGKTLLFAKRNACDKKWEESDWPVTQQNIDRFAQEEWVDLRLTNMAVWKDRLLGIIAESESTSGDTSSRFDHGGRSWAHNGAPGIVINPGEIVGWVLLGEGGARSYS